MAETQSLDRRKTRLDRPRVLGDSLDCLCDRNGGSSCDRNRDQAAHPTANARANRPGHGDGGVAQTSLKRLNPTCPSKRCGERISREFI